MNPLPPPEAGYPGDPTQPPTGGYAVPVFSQQPGYDPLISPDYAGWWSRSLAIIKVGWQPLVVLHVIGAVATLVLQVPLLVYVAMNPPTTVAGQVNPDGSAQLPDLGGLYATLGLTFAAVFVATVIGAAVTIASIQMGVSIATGQRPQVGPALMLALRRAFPLLGWQILTGLITALGVCACVLPAIYLVAVFTVLPAVVAFERGGAVSRCFTLFHKDFGPAVARVATIAGISIGVSVVAWIISSIIQTVTGGHAGFTITSTASPATGPVIVGVVLASMVTILLGQGVAVLTSQLTLTAYADLRARVEPVSTMTLAYELHLGGHPTAPWGPAAPV